MKRVVRQIQILLMSLFVASTALAGDYMEGAEYLKLASPQKTASPDKIEVVELFWYACPHCYYLEPHLEKWLETKADDVEFVRLPAILGPSWELLAKAWYTSELLGVSDKTHIALFEAIHKRRVKIDTEDKVRSLFASNGVSADDFDKTFGSFAVAVKVNNARLLTRRYAITGVPTLIVNGKYSTTATLAGGNPDLIEVLDYLVDEERKLTAASSTDTPVTAASQ